MALLWQHLADNQRYEVRNAGACIRLYKNGVLHSEFNPNQPLTGQVWDLLMLPAFFYPPQTIKRVLVLGVGGGTVIRQLQHFFNPKEIVGVDLDPIHLKIAKRFFGLNSRRIKLHCADAVTWLNEYQGDPFDMIIEDIFTEQHGQPIRAIPAKTSWAKALLRHTNEDGLVVLNFTSRLEAKASAFNATPQLAKQIRSAYLLTTPRNVNVVGAFLKPPSRPNALKNTLNAIPALDQRKKTTRLRYRITQIV